MKLYFYRLLRTVGEKPRIVTEEREAEEKPKIYKLIGETPSFYYGNTFKKENIGKLTGYADDVVVLTERDPEIVAQIFKGDIDKTIRREQDEIKVSKKIISKAYDLIDMVDDWRLENETH